MANDLTPQFRQLCEKVEALEEDRKVLFPRIHTLLEEKIKFLDARMNGGNLPDMIARIRDLEAGIRKQREENAAAHIQQSDTIMHMQEQIKGLENRLSRAQDRTTTL